MFKKLSFQLKMQTEMISILHTLAQVQALNKDKNCLFTLIRLQKNTSKG